MRIAPGTESAPLDERSCIVVYLLLAAIALAPIVAFPYPAFVDHPNHLARLYALNSPPGSALTAIYEPAWALIPNLAIDALSVVAHHWLSPEGLLQLVTLLAMGLALIAVPLLQRHFFGAVTPLAWLAVLPVINLATSMGYVNFALGLGLLLIGAWTWLVLEGRPTWVRALVANTLGAGLFFCHIMALAIFVVFVGLYELSRSWRKASDDSNTLPAAVVRSAIAFPIPIALVALAEQPEHLSIISYANKARGLIAATYSNSALAFLLGFVPLLLVTYGLVRQGLICVAAPMRQVLAGLALLALLLPAKISAAVDLDARVTVCLVFLGIGSTRIDRPSRRGVRVLGLVLLAAVSARSLVLALDWEKHAQRIKEFRGALTAVEPGAAVLTAGWSPTAPELRCATALSGPQNVFWHVPSFAVIDRSAFVPLVFTGRGMQPLRPVPAYQGLDVPASIPVFPALLRRTLNSALTPELRAELAKEGMNAYFEHWSRRFDHLVFLHHGCPTELLPNELTELASGSFFTLYRVRPGSIRNGSRPQ